MTKQRYVLMAALFLMASAALHGQATESSINKEIGGLRGVSDAQRPATTTTIANEIRTLPAGVAKLKLADALIHLVTEGDPGRDTLQAVADALAQALKETPQPAAKDGSPAMPYMDLAKLARYEETSTDLKDPQMDKADAILVANDADVAKADFTLKDMDGKKVTLSALRGKIVLVNFWATWCPPCQKEMTDLDLIYTHYQSQGLAILSISDEIPMTIHSFLAGKEYHPPVLLDTGGKVTKEFHVDSLPRSYVFDREGKLVAEAIDMRTQRQFFMMLAKAGLQPQN
jgi:peroxiredoxin